MNNDGICIYEGCEEFIFISYSHKDREMVLPVVKELSENGYRVWYDDGISFGNEWTKVITDHIKRCSFFIAFISDNYLSSDNCLDEINWSRSNKKKILPLYIEDVRLPDDLEMRVGRYQYMRMFRYKNPEEFYGKLFVADGIDECKDKTIDSWSVSNSRDSQKKQILLKKELVQPQKMKAQKTIKKKGMIYVGETQLGKMSGYGIATYANGDIYEGYWRKNIWNGRGVMKYANGDVMDAVWIDESHVQKGTLKYRNGDVCELVNVDDGSIYKASVKYTNGDEYEGEFIWEKGPNYNDEGGGKTIAAQIISKAIRCEVGNRYGYGILKSNGNVYEGDWMGDSINNATIFFKDGTVFHGKVISLRPQKGIMKYANGEIYIGDNSFAKQNDMGRRFFTNGRIEEGVSKQNSLASPDTTKEETGDSSLAIYIKDTLEEENIGVAEYMEEVDGFIDECDNINIIV